MVLRHKEGQMMEVRLDQKDCDGIGSERFHSTTKKETLTNHSAESADHVKRERSSQGNLGCPTSISLLNDYSFPRYKCAIIKFCKHLDFQQC